MKSILLIILFFSFAYANFILDKNESIILENDEVLRVQNITIEKTSKLKSGKNSTLFIEKNWINNGSFIPSTSNVIFAGDEQSIINGENIFYNFESNKDLIFEANKTQSFVNSMKIQGDAKSSYIRSSQEGLQAIFDLSTHPTIEVYYLELQDMKNIGITSALTPLNSVSISNNTLWFDKNIDENCVVQDSNIVNYNKLVCDDEREKFVTTEESKNKSEVTIEKSEEAEYTQESFDDKIVISYNEDYAQICGKNIIINMISDGTTSTGFKNSDNCKEYEDPTLKNNIAPDENTKTFILKTSKGQKKLHDDSKSVIVIEMDLTNKIVIGTLNEI